MFQRNVARIEWNVELEMFLPTPKTLILQIQSVSIYIQWAATKIMETHL